MKKIRSKFQQFLTFTGFRDPYFHLGIRKGQENKVQKFVIYKLFPFLCRIRIHRQKHHKLWNSPFEEMIDHITCKTCNKSLKVIIESKEVPDYLIRHDPAK